MVMHRRHELDGEPVLDERAVDDELGLIRATFARLPLVDLLLQRLEIPLHFIQADAEKVPKIEILVSSHSPLRTGNPRGLGTRSSKALQRQRILSGGNCTIYAGVVPH